MRSNKAIFALYLAVMFFIMFADSIMSFSAPIFMERALSNTFLMGLVMSSSSLVGILCDITFAQIFTGKHYRFFMTLLLIVSFAFPLSFLVLPPVIGSFLLGMAAWGMYFELMRFSHYDFIHLHTTTDQHASAWGILEVTRGIATILGSFLASFLIAWKLRLPFFGAIGGFASALLIFSFLLLRFDRSSRSAREQATHSHKKSFWLELRSWKALLGRIWPVFLVSLTIVIIDSAFWTIGTLISEGLSEHSFWGSLVLPAYMAPSLFIPLWANRLSKKLGKKRTAFIACIPSGLLLTLGSFSALPSFFVLAIFISSIFSALASTELSAVYEDYVSRLHDFATDLVGLSAASSSVAYIIGPIAAGFIAEQLGNNMTFALYGILLTLVAIIAFVVMPRKTRLPQNALQALE